MFLNWILDCNLNVRVKPYNLIVVKLQIVGEVLLLRTSKSPHSKCFRELENIVHLTGFNIMQLKWKLSLLAAFCKVLQLPSHWQAQTPNLVNKYRRLCMLVPSVCSINSLFHKKYSFFHIFLFLCKNNQICRSYLI